MTPVKEWSTILSLLEQKISTAAVKTWFYKSSLGRDELNNLVVVFPRIYFLERVKSHYLQDLQTAVAEGLRLPPVSLRLELQKEEKTPLGPLFLPPFTPPSTKLNANLKTLAFGLFPQYRFDNFVVGPNSQLAFDVASAVAQNPAGVYNPFFLYGGTGLGKTHLLQAIGNDFLTRFNDKKVVYATGEAFTNELLEAIQRRTQKKFREKFRQTDVLLLDDVQFVAGKEATQEELFHAFNELYLARKQIVLTSDRPPRDIPLLEERLRSRFAGGMMADLTKPDAAVGAAILRDKRDRGGYLVENAVVDFIAAQPHQSVREMEGIFLQIVSRAKTTGQEADLALAASLLSQNRLLLKQQKPTPKKVLQETETFFNVSHRDLVGPRRKQELVLARQISMYLLRQLCELSLKSIGQLLGDRDHTTIIHGIKQITQALAETGETSQKVDLLKIRICG